LRLVTIFRPDEEKSSWLVSQIRALLVLLTLSVIALRLESARRRAQPQG
jgi:uncharacterized membrane protein SirB2